MTNRWDDLKKKGEKLVGDLNKHPQVQDVKEKAMQNPKEVILGGLMVLGLVFSYWWYGSLLVGLAAGLFAPWTIKDLIERGRRFYSEEGKLPSFMLAATAVVLLLHVFWFVIGFAVGSTLKIFFMKAPQA